MVEYSLQTGAASAAEVEIDFASALNPQQFEAVTSPPGQALVIAGAGSGKTRTLTYRVAYLLANAIAAENILLLTFTNKAAREMLNRVNALVPGHAAHVWGGTFHSIGNRLLRLHADLVGFTGNFSILDSDDSKSLLSRIIDGGGFAAMDGVPATPARPGKARRKSETGFPKAPVIGGIISLAVNTCRTVEEIILERFSYFAEIGDPIKRIATTYTRKKKEGNGMDFDDLLLLTVELLRKNEAIRSYYQRQFQFILVDEYQDTNALQGEFIDLLAGPRGNIMVVGDDAQSIYSWRGANFENILKFPERHPNAQVYRIETNYRSVPEILELANDAIRANKRQFQKTLHASRPSVHRRPALVRLDTPQMQAAFVSQRLQELHRDHGIPWREMAVIYRAHFQSMDVQLQLTQDRIPFVITSGVRFFEQAHIKDVAAFLKWSANPRDETSFDRMVRLLPGVGPGAAGKLWQEWIESGSAGVEPGDDEPGVSGVTDPGYSDSASGVSDPGYSADAAALRRSIPSRLRTFQRVPPRARSGWQELCDVLDEFPDPSRPDGLQPPARLLTSVIEGIYERHLRENFENARERRQDLDQLQSFAERFASLDDMLAELALLTNADDSSPRGAESRPPRQGDDAVTLTSVHQSKGLEWKAVFLIWLTDGMFPNSRVVEETGNAGLEEERRLFYVAITRAMDHLFLCHPQFSPRAHTGDPWQKPSIFLSEIPAERLEPWNVRGW